MGAARRRWRQRPAGRRGADRQEPRRPREARAGVRQRRHSRYSCAGRRRTIDPGGVRADPARPVQGRRRARGPDRHHLARRDRLDQPRRVGQPARPVSPRPCRRRLCSGKDCLGTKVVGGKQRPACRARHRREQSVPDARRRGPVGRPVRNPPVPDRHALRPVHRPRPRCAQLRLLPGCALPARRDAQRHHARARKAARTSRSTRR